MDEKKIRRSWEAYTDAWTDLAASERELLVEASVSEGISYSNPFIAGKGRAGLIEAMDQFQQQYPGARFQPDWTNIHHDQLLSGWTLYGKDGAALLTGHNYARVDDEGKITHMAGFFNT